MHGLCQEMVDFDEKMIKEEICHQHLGLLSNTSLLTSVTNIENDCIFDQF